jgi:very-short-patch-repair endonuclease
MRRLLQSGRSGGDGVSFADLFAAPERTRAAASLKEIATRARSNFEERGLDTLFLAMGLAAWKAEDGGRDARAPVVLVPLEVVQQGTRVEVWRVRRAGDLRVSDVLLHALTAEHGVTLDGEALLRELQGDDEGEEFDTEQLFASLRAVAAKVPDFRIEPRWVVGNFAFQKMAIVRDLKELLEPLAQHDIVAALSGDRSAEASARGDRTSVDPRQMDAVAPDAEFLIRDADSSQQQAIAATLNGQNGVISGPPGTGKSQTISNLIAELVARGKTVLFVAEKRAALDVVLNRLKDAGLAHLCLDCHGADISRKVVAQQLQQSLEMIRDSPVPNTAEPHRQFVDRRDRLNAHVGAMHSPRQPSGLSLYALYGALLRLPPESESPVRFTGATLKRLDEATLRDSCELMVELALLSDLLLGRAKSPWLGAQIADEAVAREAHERATRLAHDTLPRLTTALQPLWNESGVRPPGTIGELRRFVPLFENLAAMCGRFDEALFAADLAALASALRPARSLVSRLVAQVVDTRYRAALRQVRAWHREGTLTAPAAFTAVEEAGALLQQWKPVSGSALPARWHSWPPADAAWKSVDDDLSRLQQLFSPRSFDAQSLEQVTAFARELAADAVTPGRIRRLSEIRRAFDERGLGPIVADLVARQPPLARWPDALRHAWMASTVEDVQLGDTAVAAFDGRRHDDIAREFKSLDAERLRLAVQRVWRAHAVAAVEARNRQPAQSTLVQREAQKKARHLPLRRLFTEAPDVLLALRPCWMASPLSVSQLLPGDRAYFDVVVFDEASQVLPEDAITSLLRRRQAVVAGDQRQLPPTTFFAAGTEQEEKDEGDETAGFQSILDQMTAFLDPPWSLDWHYRSRDESLIAYSNHRIYGGRLVTFPGAASEPAIRHELIPHVPGEGAQEQSAGREVQRVVDLVLEHARNRPDESLGVITMGITHANRIEAALYRAREEHPELEDFFAVDRPERFFVKNLERVQGDERDAIILSVGYGKNEAGHVVYRFGPLLQEGGERRLNVAITRARSRMTVVSSFSHNDLDPAYKKVGVQHLRAYLEYAASGGRTLETGTVTEVPLNDFEQAVRDELVRRGLNVVGQVGSSRYRIDLVTLHPTKPGRFVLAIECDGASYHAAPTARDRDRLRQQQLEALGWRFCRIWSTDWFLRREDEVQRVMRAHEEAVREADARDADGVAAVSRVADTVDADELPVPPVSVASPAARGPRPAVPAGLSIDDYSSQSLQRLARWIASDGRLRTDDEMLTEMVRELGFARRGSKIVEALTRAIAGSTGRG